MARKRKKSELQDDNFIMSPKYDFVFKYIFGNDKHKDLLVALLSDILGIPEEEFDGIDIINSELIREFKEDRKGILDVRIRTKLKKLYSSYHLTEDKTGYRLTDILEVHFLEIPKLFDEKIERDENDPVVQWMEFLDAGSKGGMEMLAKKNKDIKKAYDLLQIISKDEKARMLYEAEQAEISDQLTRIKLAEEKGITKGAAEKAIKIAENLLKMGLTVEQVASASELTREKVVELKKKYQN